MSDFAILPITKISVEVEHRRKVDAFVNSFGARQEQRIVTDLPSGPRADGRNTQTTYVGTNLFSITLTDLLFATQPVSGNANLDNSIWMLWDFYNDRFYNPSTGAIQWEPFYFYNPSENDDFSTWTGSDVSSGTNSRGEAVTEVSGRYKVRFSSPEMTITQFKHCLFRSGLELIEVEN